MSSEDFKDDRSPYAPPTPVTQDPLALPQTSAEVFTDGNLDHAFWTIWTRPRRTIRAIVEVNPEFHVILLACLSGIVSSLDRASSRNTGESLPLAAIVGLSFVVGPLGGLFGLWFGSHLLRLTGTWIGGESDRTDIKAALAWASVPSVVSLCLWLPAILLFGSENFTAFTPRIRSQPLLLIPYFAFTILQVVLGVWGFVILCNTIAEVQEFGSAWKGLLNMFLAVVVVIVPLILFLLAMIMLSIA